MFKVGDYNLKVGGIMCKRGISELLGKFENKQLKLFNLYEQLIILCRLFTLIINLTNPMTKEGIKQQCHITVALL